MGKNQHRTVIYARVSDDQDGRSRSVDQQLDECRRWCAEKGWPVVAELTDVDISASRYGRKARAGWSQVMALVTAGDVDALVAWDLDRLLRQPRELETLIDLAERKQLAVQTLGAGDLDLSTVDGRTMARVIVAFAAAESDKNSRRVKRAKADKAARGEPARSSGVGVPFGWADGTTPDPDESAVVAEAIDNILSGATTLSTLARDWTAVGYRTAHGANAWWTSTVKQVLTNPKHAGLLVHRGEIKGTGNWPAIIDVAKHEQIKAHFAAQAATAKRRPRRVAPLTRLVRCGKCGHPMFGSQASGRRVYVCKRSLRYADRCGGVGITAEPLDALIFATVFELVDRGSVPLADAAPAAAADPAALAEHERLTRLIDELADDLVEGRVDRAVYLATAEKLTAKRDAVELPEPPAVRQTAADKFLGRPGALAEAWPDLADDEKNRILSSVIDHITVAPLGAGKRVPPQERIDVVWKV